MEHSLARKQRLNAASVEAEALAEVKEKPTYVYMCTGFKWQCMCPRHVRHAPRWYRKQQVKKHGPIDEVKSRERGSMLKRVVRWEDLHVAPPESSSR